MRTNSDPSLERTLAVVAQVLAFAYSAASQLRPSSLLVDTFNDDAAYYLNIARNYAAGFGWTFDRVGPTNGFQPLWQYLLVGLCRLLPGTPESQVRWTGLTETILHSAACLLLWRLIDRQFGARAGMLMCVMYIACFSFLTRTGMETALFVLIVAAILTQVANGSPWRAATIRPALGFGVLLGALMLTRLDSLFFAATLTLVLALDAWRADPDARRRALLRGVASCALAAAAVIPYLAYNVAAFGHLMPISGAVKSSFPVPGWYLPEFGLSGEQRAMFLAANLLAVGVLLVRIGVPLRADSRIRGLGFVPLALGVLLHHLYSALFMKWGVMSWHFALGRLLACVLLALLLDRVLARLPAGAVRRGAIATGVLILLATSLAVYRRDWGMLSKNSWRQRSHDAALWVKEHLPADAVLAMKDSGHMGLFSERRVVNLDGIVNNFEYQERMSRGEFAAYLEDHRIDYIVYGAPPRPYGSFTFHNGSRLHGGKVGSIQLYESDEIYRSREFTSRLGTDALVISRVRHAGRTTP